MHKFEVETQREKLREAKTKADSAELEVVLKRTELTQGTCGKIILFLCNNDSNAFLEMCQ